MWFDHLSASTFHGKVGMFARLLLVYLFSTILDAIFKFSKQFLANKMMKNPLETLTSHNFTMNIP